MTATDIRPWSLIHGASWLTEDGTVWAVPGFHEDWIREHAGLLDGAANVCEVVLGKRWISVTCYDEGYVELLVPDRADPSVMARVERLLTANRPAWSSVLVMSMCEEGYSLCKASDLGPDGKLEPHHL